MSSKDEQERAVVPHRRYPLGRADGGWDGTAAEMQMRRWASEDGSGDPDMVDWEMYQRGFIWYDEENEETFGAYKGPHHEIADGDMVTPLPGVRAAMGALLGARGGFDVPEADRRPMYDHLADHYREFDVEPPEFREYSVKELRQMFLEPCGISADDYRKLKPDDALIIFGEQDIVSIAGGGMKEDEFFDSLAQRGEVVRGGVLTELDDDVQRIFAERIGLNPDEVYVFPVIASNQALDAYGTRMSAESLERYAKDVISGVPLMNSHKTGDSGGIFGGGKVYAELPIGHSFHGELDGEAIDESPMLLEDGKFRQEDPMQPGLFVRSYDYMLRDHYPNGRNEPGTEDVIKSIEGKTLREISIGFGHATPDYIWYVCGLCGEDYRKCEHLALLPDGETGLTGFVWVHGARMLEHSTVWRGATPGAIIEKARAMATAGRMSPVHTDYLESLWHVRLMPSGLISFGSKLGARNMDEAKREDVTEEIVEEVIIEESEGEEEHVIEIELNDGVSEQLANVATALEAFDGVLRGVEATVTGLGDAISCIDKRVQAIEERVVGNEGRMGLLTDAFEKMQSQVVEQVETETQTAQKRREELIDEAVAAKVRAGVVFDETAYRSRLDKLDDVDIKAEIEETGQIVAAQFKPGRVVGRAQGRSIPDTDEDVVSVQERKNRSLGKI